MPISYDNLMILQKIEKVIDFLCFFMNSKRFEFKFDGFTGLKNAKFKDKENKRPRGNVTNKLL